MLSFFYYYKKYICTVFIFLNNLFLILLLVNEDYLSSIVVIIHWPFLLEYLPIDVNALKLVIILYGIISTVILIISSINYMLFLCCVTLILNINLYFILAFIDCRPILFQCEVFSILKKITLDEKKIIFDKLFVEYSSTLNVSNISFECIKEQLINIHEVSKINEIIFAYFAENSLSLDDFSNKSTDEFANAIVDLLFWFKKNPGFLDLVGAFLILIWLHNR